MAVSVLHRGGCHCGRVRFSFTAPPSLVAWSCNCSNCSMRGNLHSIIPASSFALAPSTSADALTEYRFGSCTARHLFCSACGITSYYVPRSNPDGVAVTIACIDAGTVASVDVKSFDGRNWEASHAASGIAACSELVAAVAPPPEGVARLNEWGLPIGPPLPPGWRPCALPSRTVPLIGRYCTLEPMDATRHGCDLAAAWASAIDARDWTYLFESRPADASAYATFIATLEASVDPFHYAIVDTTTRRAVGSISLMRLQPEHGVVEIGHVIYSPLLQRSCAGTEAIALLLSHAFDDLRYRRVEWKCDALNARSKGAAGRYGFVEEGVFRSAIVYKGRARDTAWFSMLAGVEWHRVRDALRAWLSPDNFDAAGRQREPLAARAGVPEGAPRGSGGCACDGCPGRT